MAAQYDANSVQHVVVTAQYTCPAGRVDFRFSKVPANCGIVLFHDINFVYQNTAERDDLFRRFDRYLMASKGHAQIQRAKMMMTDADQGNISKFCRAHGWEEDTPVHNRKSGNDVTVFTKKKTPSTVSM